MDQNKLLHGNIKKQIIHLAAPLLAGNILQQLYSIIDSWMIGHYLGTNAFAAAGLSSAIMNLFLFITDGFCVGLSILFARLYGIGKLDAFRREFFITLSMGCLFTVGLSLSSVLLLRPILWILRTPGTLVGYAVQYLTIILGCLLFTYLYHLFSGILRAIGNTQCATYFLLLSVLLNILLDYLFIALFSFGIAGAAYATVISQGTSALCCFLYIKHKVPYLLFHKEDCHFHKKLIGDTFAFGLSSALHQSSIYLGKTMVQGAVNTLGIEGISAYTATMRIEDVINAFGSSGSQAMSILISQNFGAGKKKRIQKALKDGMLLHIGTAIFLSSCMFFLAKPGIGFFLAANEKTALAYGNTYLKIISFFYLFCYIGNAYVGYFRGIGKVSIPLIGSTLQITIRVILTCLLIKRFGLPCLAVATGIGWIGINLYQTLVYQKLRHPERFLFKKLKTFLV